MKRRWPKGKCRVCDREVVTWDGGFIRPHNDPRTGVRCDGSHRKPSGEVERVPGLPQRRRDARCSWCHRVIKTVVRHGLRQLPRHKDEVGAWCDGGGSIGAPVVVAPERVVDADYVVKCDAGPAAKTPSGEIDLSELHTLMRAKLTAGRGKPPVSSRHFVQTNACALGLNCMVMVPGRRRAGRPTFRLYSLSIPWARLGEVVLAIGRRISVDEPTLKGWTQFAKGLDF